MIAIFNKAILKGRFAILIVLLGVFSSANAQTIKLATIAPEGSAWMDAMRAGAKEIADRTEGRVKFKFYGGGVQGNDKQVMRKMRIGQLHGGAFTSNALAAMHKDSQLYALPMLFNNLDEVKFVRERMDEKLRSALERAGYVNFGFAGGGFANIMSNSPIATLANMQNLKVWVPDGDRLSYGAVEALGVSPVTMPLTDVLTGLQTELIDTIISPPAGTIVLQWNTAVSYITELPLAYIFAMLVIQKKTFDRLQPGDQAIVREVMEGVYKGFDEQGNEDNEKAFQALLDDGMKAVAPDHDQVATWRSIVRESNHKLAAEGAIDIRLVNEIECLINSYREGNLEKVCTQ
jgi:TRAP-type C4-dicarboxylate transport system substrate-binding protein